MSISVGEIKELQAEMTSLAGQLWTGLTNAISGSSEMLANGMALSAEQYRELGRNAMQEFDAFQQGVMNSMENRAFIPAAQMQLYRENWTNIAADFAERDAAAQEGLGRELAASAAESSRAALANAGGMIVDGAQLAAAIAEAAQTGDMSPVGKAIGEIAGGALGGVLGGVLAGFLATLFGLAALPAAILAFAAIGLFAFLGSRYLGDIIGDGWNGIFDLVADMFNAASNWMQRRDPLTLDLDGDGIESVGLRASNPILFDHDGDGVRNGTAWVSSDDGFLVLDRNGNGSIDNGRELFGDSTPLPNGTAAEDGFAALAAEDTNGDGAVTAADARFSQLRVWRDLNQDGVSGANELFTLSQLGITAINVASVARDQVLGNGNRIADVGTYVRSDGTEGSVGETHGAADVDLASDTFHREFTDEIPLVDGVKELPNSPGSGLVRDLWEAASQSPALFDILEDFSNAATRAEQLILIDTLLLTWADTAGMQTMEERAEAIEHRFAWWRIGDVTYPGSGFGWVAAGSGGGGGGSVAVMPANFPDPALWEQRRAEWDALVARTNNLFAVLEAFNGRYFFSMPEDTFQGARSGVAIVADSGGTGGGAVAYVPGPPGITIGIAQAQVDALNASYAALREFVYNALALQTRLEVLTDMTLVDFVDGGGIELDFTDVEAELHSRIAADAVTGMADLIEYTRGMTRRLAGTTFAGWEMIQHYVGTLPHTPALEALYEEFGIQYAAGTAATDNGGEGANIIIGRNQAAGETESLRGNGGADALIGNGGRDYLYGDSGVDVLFGGDGSDHLYGGANEDTLVGGTGNDYLTGDGGDDVFVFGRGDGQDVVNAYDVGEGKRDELRLGPDVGVDDVTLTQYSGDLVISIVGTADRITISNFFSSSAYAITGIRLSDGTIWDRDDIGEKVQTGTAGNDTLTAHATGSALSGGEGNDTLIGGRGRDTLQGDGGNDLLSGGEGNDNLQGGYGNDTAEGGDGDDAITDTSGANILRGGAGVDTINGTGTIEGGTGNDLLTGASTSNLYIYNLGDGIDTITDNGNGAAIYADTLQFGAGINPASVTLQRTGNAGNDLTFRISDTDQIIVKNWFADAYYNAIENFTFADGTVWNHASMYHLTGQPFTGTAAAETINGWDGIDILDGGDGNDTLNGAGSNDVLTGGAGNDVLHGGDGNDVLSGGEGNDILQGGYGNDTAEGGVGDDAITDTSGANILRGGAGVDTINGTGTIEGGTGNDLLTGTSTSNIYVYNLGDGIDTITDNGNGAAIYADTLQFGAGISPASLTTLRTGNDLTFRISDTDQIIVKNWFADAYYNAIENFTFADGTVWNHASMYHLTGQPFAGTAAAETINGWDGIDILDGGDGNDTLNGAGSNDVLTGGAGNDVLRAGEGDDTVTGDTGNDTLQGDGGNDVLSGGEGNDILQGGYGNDTAEGGVGDDAITDTSGANILRGGAGVDTINGTGTIEGGTGNDLLTGTSTSNIYVYNLGDGIDTITDNGNGAAIYADTLQFGAGISPASLTTLRTGNDLTFRISDTDQIIVKNWFADAYYNAIENFTFADGTVWNHASMYHLTGQPFAGTAAAETINGWDGIDILDGGDGNDTLNGAGSNDVLTGGAGNDVLRAGEGDDTVTGDTGNDTLQGDGGNDVLSGGEGNDILQGGYGNDTAEGGVGDDAITDTSGANILRGGAGVDTINGTGTIEGGTGNDLLTGTSTSNIYVYNLGDGIDTITDNGNGAAIYADTLQFGAGISPASLTTLRTGNDLTFRISDTDQIIVKNWFADAYYNAIENFTFADGTVWNHASMYHLTGQPFAGTAAAETINGWDGIDILDGGDGNDTLNGAGSNDVLTGGAGNDVLRAGEGDDTVTGDTGNDTLQGDGGNDVLSGGEGNDILQGGYGNDTAEGGVGDDAITDTSGANILRGGAGVDTINGTGTIEGGTGNDLLTGTSTSNIYVYNLGDGIDTITDNGNGAAIYADTLQFGAGISPASLTTLRTGNDLTFRISDTDQIIVKNWFADAYYNAIENFTFADGTVWNHASMYHLTGQPFAGTAAAETINGWDGIDILDGGDGNDTLNGAGSNDVLTGGAGNDVLRAGEGDDTVTGDTGNDTLQGDGGNDVLSGGEGNDILQGGYGNDTAEGGVGDDAITDTSGANILRGGAGVDTINGTGTIEGGTGNDLLTGTSTSNIYVYNLGDGIDTITDNGNGAAIYADTLQFGAGISPASLTTLRTGNDLTFRISDTDQIIVKNWFADAYYNAIENFTFADGTVWNHASMQSVVPQQIHVGTSGTETINGWFGIDLIDGAGGNDTLNGNEGNDLLIGNDGNDILNGHAGTDLLQGGAGDDQLNDSTGPGLFDGGAGNDSLVGSSAANFFAGGAGNDTITTGSGVDIIGFNRGDGADTVPFSTGTDNTLSLGGGIAYADLSLRRSGNDLIVDAGSGDQITFQSWYTSTQYRSVLNLQVVAEAMAGFNPSGADALRDQKVETFSFTGLVTRFDQERAANPALTSWAVISALTEFHTGGSDSAALGGDLAHEFGLNRSLTGVGYGASQSVMNDSTFGVTAQALNSAAAVYAGQVRLG